MKDKEDEDDVNFEDDSDVKKSSSIQSDVNLFGNNEEVVLNKQRLEMCLYIFGRINHEFGDSMILHAANIMINTINKVESKFSMDLVEELLKDLYFERLLRNIIPFRYKIQDDTLLEIKEFSVACMKTSISVVFNLIQI